MSRQTVAQDAGSLRHLAEKFEAAASQLRELAEHFEQAQLEGWVMVSHEAPLRHAFDCLPRFLTECEYKLRLAVLERERQQRERTETPLPTVPAAAAKHTAKHTVKRGPRGSRKSSV